MSLLDKPILAKDPDYKKKILLFDIETAPNLAYVWGKWEQDVIAFKEHWYMISFAWKWLGEKETYVVALPDFKTYKKDKTSDEELCKKLWDLFNEADILIGHNGDSFDIKKSNARFLKWGLEPPHPYKTVDTLKIARRNFKLDSNKLDDLGDYFKLGRKVHTGGFNLWLGCLSGDVDSWALMKKYNRQDVILLEKVYYKLRGWDKSAPNLNLIYGGIFNCPKCGSNHVNKQGFNRSKVAIYQSYHCMNCGGWSQGEIVKRDKPLK
jgi:DNA polymerase elongation subunit (family B)